MTFPHDIIPCTKAIGHTRKLPDGTVDPITEPLTEHLCKVARLTQEFAARFGMGAVGRLIGLLHDLGKYKPKFQARIMEALLNKMPTIKKVDHMTPGALYAYNFLKKHDKLHAMMAYYVISGHHGGLLNWDTPSESRNRSIKETRSNKNLLKEALENGGDDFIKNYIDASDAEVSKFGRAKNGKSIMWEYYHHRIRLMFSALIDADCLATEEFCSPERSAKRNASKPTLADLFYNRYRPHMNAMSDTTSAIGIWRNAIKNKCLAMATGEKGIYTLTSQTGSGKTLATLGFALLHAINHNMDRIIICIPRCSIIEQTVDVLRKIFGEDAVVEHHSNLDFDKNSETNKLYSENWDAPIVVTTDVQLFESMQSSRNSRCRKLHNLVNSVVIIDEVHLLPTNELKSIAESIKVLTSPLVYRSTVLLTTATMPSYELIGIVNPSGDNPLMDQNELHITPLFGKRNLTEILDENLQKEPVVRVKYENLRVRKAEEISDLIISKQISKQTSVLAISNTNPRANELYKLIVARNPQCKVFFLSGMLCGEHRSVVIKEIKDCLVRDERIIVVSTPIVEVGVDIDFPVVFREECGMEGISQSGGRCNRNGKLQLGFLYVYRLPISYNDLPSDMSCRASATDHILKVSGGVFPEHFTKEYYARYYAKYLKEYIKESISESIRQRKRLSPEYYYNTSKSTSLCATKKCAKSGKFNFETLNDTYQLIPDNQTQVIIPFNEEAMDYIERLNDANTMVSYSEARKMQRYVVNVYKDKLEKLITAGYVKRLEDTDVCFLTSKDSYDANTGLFAAIDAVS